MGAGVTGPRAGDTFPLTGTVATGVRAAKTGAAAGCPSWENEMKFLRSLKDSDPALLNDPKVSRKILIPQCDEQCF